MDPRDSDAVDSGRITAYGSRRPGSSNRNNTAGGYDAARYAAPSSSSTSSRGVQLEFQLEKWLQFCSEISHTVKIEY